MSKDITYCSANCLNTECIRNTSKEKSIDYIWLSDFSKECKEYQPVLEEIDDEETYKKFLNLLLEQEQQ